MDWVLTCRIMFLGLAVLWTLINVCRMTAGNSIPFWNFVLQTVGLVGFIASMGWLK